MALVSWLTGASLGKDVTLEKVALVSLGKDQVVPVSRLTRAGLGKSDQKPSILLKIIVECDNKKYYEIDIKLEN